MAIESRSEAEAGSGQVVGVAFFRVLSGSEGAVDGGDLSSFFSTQQGNLAFFLASRGWDLEHDSDRTTPFLAEAIGKKCSLDALSTSIGCGSSWRFQDANRQLRWVDIGGDTDN